MLSATVKQRRPESPEARRLRRLEESQEMGRALGQLAIFMRLIQDLEDRVADLERDLYELRNDPR
jgi:hypothetical protein